MPTSMIRQTSFALGEVDQVNWRRTDMREYLAATQVMQNMEASTTAVCRKRRGFQKLNNITDVGIPEIQSYEFKDANGTYYIVFAVDEAFEIYEAITWTHYQTVVTPYQAADLETLDYTQNNDVIIFAQGDYPIARLYVSSYSPSVVFSYQALNIYPKPAYDYGNINYNDFNVTFGVVGTTGTLTLVALATNPGYNNDWVGGQIIGLGGSSLAAAGYGIITAVTAWSGAGTDVVFTIDILQEFGTPYGAKGSNYVIRQPVFTAGTGYPRTVVVYQNRLWVGGIRTLPETVFGSKINTLVSFDNGINRDSDAISYNIGIANSGNIVNLNSGKQLEIFTENIECVCPQDAGIALTPDTLSIRQQTAYGSDGTLKPLTYLNDSFYVAKGGNSIMQFHYNGIGQAYSSKNISQLASHLVNRPIDRAIQRANNNSQDNYIYFLNENHTITSLQFDTGYKLCALSNIALPDKVNCLNLVSINNQIVAVVNLTETDEYELWGLNDDIFMDGWFNETVGADHIISGLSELEGYILTVYYEGQDFGDVVVEGGEVTIPDTIDIGETVTLGMIYDVLLRTMFVYAGRNMMDAYKRVTKIYVDYYNSLDFEVDGDTVPYQNYEDIQNEVPLAPRSGQYKIGCTKGWQQEQTIDITQHAPFDLQLQSISYQIAVRLI